MQYSEDGKTLDITIQGVKATIAGIPDEDYCFCVGGYEDVVFIIEDDHEYQKHLEL
jgi:hypothetical protein